MSDSDCDVNTSLSQSPRAGKSKRKNTTISEFSGAKNAGVDAAGLRRKVINIESHCPYCGCKAKRCICGFAFSKMIPTFTKIKQIKSLPELKDKFAARIQLYRAELKGVGIIDNLTRLNYLVLAISQQRMELEFPDLFNGNICTFYKMKGRKYVPIPPKYYNDIEYFWLTFKVLVKLCRRYPTESDTLTTNLFEQFCWDTWINRNGIPDSCVYSHAHAIICREFKKFEYIVQQIKHTEKIFKTFMKHTMVESLYKDLHWDLRVLIRRINGIQNDMSSLGLTKYHTEFYIDNMRLTKKRLHANILKLDADMKKSIERAHAHVTTNPLEDTEAVIESESEADQQPNHAHEHKHEHDSA